MSRRTVDKENMYKFIADCYQFHIFLLLHSRLNIMSLCECVPGDGGGLLYSRDTCATHYA